MTPFILTVPETRDSEAHFCKDHSALDLMESAGHACAEEISLRVLKDKRRVVLFCGPGNNGGDGLVIARLLAKLAPFKLTSLEVILCQEDPTRCSPLFTENLSRWKRLRNLDIPTRTYQFRDNRSAFLKSDDLVIDALFGIGLDRKMEGLYAQAIQVINASDAYVVSIDIPSGLYADQHTPVGHDIVMADLTLSIQFWKTVFLLPEAAPYYGKVEVLNIDPRFKPIREETHAQELLMEETVGVFLQPANPFAHKGSKGHGLLIAGCQRMPGAAILAATAALRGGLGKVTVHTTERALQALPIALPEAILDPDEHPDHFSGIRWEKLPSDISAIAIGPGLGTHPQTVVAIKDVLERIQAPIVIDADALNMLADNKTWLAYLPPYSILTPHPREFERLAGPFTDNFDRMHKAKAFAQRYSCILILKGHHTLICHPDGSLFFNSTGNEGMATAGSGDILTGLLLALLAQGYTPPAAALLGVFIHGRAGDLYLNSSGTQSLIASDLPIFFGQAFKSLLPKSSGSMTIFPHSL